MSADIDREGRLALAEARLRTLELSAQRAAKGLEDQGARLARVERLLRIRLHIERLEAAER